MEKHVREKCGVSDVEECENVLMRVCRRKSKAPTDMWVTGERRSASHMQEGVMGIRRGRK